MIAKSISIKVQGCKSGRCVAKAVVLIAIAKSHHV
jgi:hypothetical protein